MSDIILNTHGRLAEAMRRARQQGHVGNGRKIMVILKTLDPDSEEQHWILVAKKDVPISLLDADAMGMMATGELAKPPGSEWWYRAESLVDYEKTLQRTLAAQKYAAE